MAVAIPTAEARAADVIAALAAGAELGLLDVRPEADHAEGHPLFAASLPLDRLELDAPARLPRRAARLVVFGADDGEARHAVARLRELGYGDVSALAGGLDGWSAAAGELYRDVNVPSKAFGELVAERCATPSIEPEELDRRLRAGAEPTAVLDVRRPDEYRTMSIPTARSAPGATLVRHAAGLADGGLVVVNCAGRTRSIIGAQTLVNAGLTPRVAALRNGTIGWTLAGLTLDTGQDRHARTPVGDRARTAARSMAQRAGVTRIDAAAVDALLAADRTVYRFDVRSPEEHRAGHLPGFRSAPGGQLVQETDRYAPVRGAAVVLADAGGTEAEVTGSWLAQMGWTVAIRDAVTAAELTETGDRDGDGTSPRAPLPEIDWWTADEAAPALARGELLVLDVSLRAEYRSAHLPGALWASRAALLRDGSPLAAWLLDAPTVLVVSREDVLTAFAVADLARRVPGRIVGLRGGTEPWACAGRPVQHGAGRALTTPRDRYWRPYEGTDASPEAMRSYLEWEYGLVEQLRRDPTHNFDVLEPA